MKRRGFTVACVALVALMTIQAAPVAATPTTAPPLPKPPITVPTKPPPPPPPPTPPISTVQPGALTPFTALDVNNPKRGQYENLMEGLFPQSYPAQKKYPPWPAAFDAGDRFDWRALQPTPTTFDFAPIDTEIAKAAAAGKRFHFRVAAFNSCCLTSYPNNIDIGVPDWLRALPGATKNYLHDGITYVIPDWNNDKYLSAAERLITALGRRYNKDERVEWFEFSGYGDFSENQIAFMRDKLGAPGPAPEQSIAKLGYYSQYRDQSITKASITRLVKATLAAFPDTQIIVNPGNPELTRQLLNARPLKPVGIRGDCLGVYEPPQTWAVNQWSYYVQHNDPLVATIRSRWKTAPVITEWCNWQPNGDLPYFQQAIRNTVNYHVSLVSSAVSPYQGTTTMPANIYDLWSRTNKFAGYRYAVTRATLPPTVAAGRSLPVTVQWTNFGSAPSYDNWQVTYEVIDRSNKVVKSVPSGLSLASLAAAQDFATTATEPASQSVDDRTALPTIDLATGTYTLIAKVIWKEHKSGGSNPVNFAPMSLAQAGRNAAGGYPIGSFRVG
ncbi:MULTISPECIES: DUF4832 domain-containing protein [unclassified Mycobacterium]|uniref:DUF4832 domain-containing protein n=1 Tax=unclassified Mycobacterium TaxID=2642494 RepID=UPI0029C834B0|nr:MULTISPECIES: DUF4832 domain-containing protein [unclassified Mycobacterium]